MAGNNKNAGRRRRKRRNRGKTRSSAPAVTVKGQPSGVAKTQRPQGMVPGVQATTGTDLIHVETLDLSNNNTPALGKVIMDFAVNPRHFLGSRLSQESGLWSRWRPLSLRLRVVSSATSLVAGSYIVGWSANPLEVFKDGMSSVQKCSSLYPNRSGHISTALEVSMPIETSRKWYMCQGHPDDAAHGKMVAVLTAPVSGYNQGSIAVSFYLDWKVAFEGPDYPQEKEEVIGDSTCQTGNCPDPPGQGNIILFSGTVGPMTATGAAPGRLYKVNSADGVKYYTSATEAEPTGKCKYFLTARTSDQTRMWFFAVKDLDKALEYLDGGPYSPASIFHKYYKDGPVTPRLAFLEIPV